MLSHLHTELARHAGHADIIRESIDGQTSYALVARYRSLPLGTVDASVVATAERLGVPDPINLT